MERRSCLRTGQGTQLQGKCNRLYQLGNRTSMPPHHALKFGKAYSADAEIIIYRFAPPFGRSTSRTQEKVSFTTGKRGRYWKTPGDRFPSSKSIETPPPRSFAHWYTAGDFKRIGYLIAVLQRAVRQGPTVLPAHMVSLSAWFELVISCTVCCVGCDGVNYPNGFGEQPVWGRSFITSAACAVPGGRPMGS